VISKRLLLFWIIDFPSCTLRIFGCLEYDATWLQLVTLVICVAILLDYPVRAFERMRARIPPEGDQHHHILLASLTCGCGWVTVIPSFD
jgi:hypothetical protein